jgi:hypothetical protein
VKRVVISSGERFWIRGGKKAGQLKSALRWRHVRFVAVVACVLLATLTWAVLMDGQGQTAQAVPPGPSCPGDGILLNVEAPILSGVDVVGGALTTSNGGWTYTDGSPAAPNVFRYTWWRDGSKIANAEAKSYTLTSGDVGHNIYAHVGAAIGTFCGKVGNADSNTLLFRNVAAGDYSYSQAVSAGLDVQPTPAQWGLPQCPADDTFDGFATEDDAEAAAAAAPDEPDCATDPSDSSVSVGDPMVHSTDPVTGLPGAYHYAGEQTNGEWRGGQVTIQVSNPAVDHTSCRTPGCGQEFVASRILAKSKFATSAREGPWIEIGWIERSYFSPDVRRLYTAIVSRSRPFAFALLSPARYPVVDGRYYTFRIRTCTGGTGPCAFVLWRRNGVTRWEPVRGNADMACASGTNCRFEYFLEVYSEQASDPHPGLNAAERVPFRRLKIRNSSSWVPLTPLDIPVTTTQTPPYIVCGPAGSTDPTGFDARRAASC